jgi:hypothetical protein
MIIGRTSPAPYQGDAWRRLPTIIQRRKKKYASGPFTARTHAADSADSGLFVFDVLESSNAKTYSVWVQLKDALGRRRRVPQ